ncbi:MAG: hypothetical protein JWP75_3545 [Frondihabitans sp.]|nr:hypothetical protein [Frondihabitans sp.]
MEMTETPPVAPPSARARKPRRERSLTESLLSIMLVLEACVLFFVILNVSGAGYLPVGLAWGGGLAFIAVMVLVSQVLRYRWGIVLACLVQVGIALTGILVVLMYVVAALFIALWIFCLWKGITVDRRNNALRAWMEANPGVDPRSYQS